MKKSKDLIILSIETSCDDTCIAVLEVKNSKLEVRSSVVSSQVKIHKKYGGVFPTLAKREHQKNLPLVLKKALQKAKLPLKDIDLIAVTAGPGLEPCLWTGINFAKDLAKSWNLPIVPVNHIEAHIFANFVGSNSIHQLADNSLISGQNSKLFPAVCLIVSGGHTQLILMRDFGKYKILGETRDDAAGECFDKCARILGLGYPGGPAIAKIAKIGGGSPSVKLPRPMLHTKNYDFSFSGLKTAVLYAYQKQPIKIRKSKKYIQTMAAEIQQAIIDVLIHKTLKAAKDYKVKSIILGGGVTANQELRKQFIQRIKKEKLSFRFQVPSFKFCLDNAVMIGITAYFHSKGRQSPLPPDMLKANANLRIR